MPQDNRPETWDAKRIFFAAGAFVLVYCHKVVCSLPANSQTFGAWNGKYAESEVSESGPEAEGPVPRARRNGGSTAGATQAWTPPKGRFSAHFIRGLHSEAPPNPSGTREDPGEPGRRRKGERFDPVGP